jgi:D-alanyl-lipoteichoic acid acyltransferase DltB (MBOAT superfamily)
MLFPTLEFGLFFLFAFAVVWAASCSNEWRKILLLLGSWVFYGAWDWRFVALLIGSAFLNWGAARIVDAAETRAMQRAVVTIGVIANLGILGFFKYYDFFLEQLGGLLTHIGFGRDLPLMQIVLPIGVSFFTFQAMSYLIDVYRGRVKAGSLLDITLLMSFFPHLVAGPIVRASDLLPQFRKVPKLDRGMVAMALLLIVWGLFKKAVVASELSVNLVDPVFFDPAAHSSLDLLMAAYGYAVQIYCDFSAYSDMAIGIAALFGYRFPRNFNQPYRASSLQDFWRRWHISLSSWLRDYLYIGLGGNRGGLFMQCRNIALTMLLGGFWHGAKWTFLIWGGLHGAVQVIETLWRKARLPGLPKPLAIIVTFHIVTLGWIFFRAESFDAAIAYLGGILHGDWRNTVTTPLLGGMMVVGMAYHFTPPYMPERLAMGLRRLPAPAFGLLIAAVILIIDSMRYEGVAPFIYYQF